MAARLGQKIKLLCLLDILKKYTDEEHPLPAAELCRMLEERGITAERKALYNDIEVLTGYGYDIISTRVPRSGYFLGARDFELPEIYLLADAVRSADFISAKKTRELVQKLDGMLSIYQAQKREKNIFFNTASKCGNEEIYYVIDGISAAIEQRKKITFKYGVRRLNEQRELEMSFGERKVSPYAMTWQEDHYYLICNYEKYDNLLHLRIDRMYGVAITDEEIRPFSEVSDYSGHFDIADYTSHLFLMHSGPVERIRLECEKRLIEQVADRFSGGLSVQNVTDTHFNITVKAAVSEGLVSWIAGFGGAVRVIEPESLRTSVINRARKILEIYGNDN